MKRVINFVEQFIYAGVSPAEDFLRTLSQRAAFQNHKLESMVSVSGDKSRSEWVQIVWAGSLWA
jgi:hypothetical protein